MHMDNGFGGKFENILPLTLREHITRLFLVILASTVMAVNMKSFVEAGGLFPGGFNGLTLLIQRSTAQFLNLSLPFSLINFLLNAVPAVISFRFIGRRFTLYSCLMIFLTSVLTDVIPPIPLTNDVLLICIFGGMLNGLAIGLCLLGRATSGGTDFIAVALSDKWNIDAWNYILLGNIVMLVIAGLLFGWDKALYSIIFQFSSTQVVKTINLRVKRVTLLIITQNPSQIYELIKKYTHHSATMFSGTGLYNGEPRTLIYSVVSGDQVRNLTKQVRKIDGSAFINTVKTDQISGRFYRAPND